MKRLPMLALLLILPAQVTLACCPTGTGGAPAQSGLGDSSPPTDDLAPYASVDVYAFELDGVRYLQLNDGGRVRFAVGRIGDTLWAVPVGADATRVRLPGDQLPAAPGEVVYTGEVIVTRYRLPDGDLWAVSPKRD